MPKRPMPTSRDWVPVGSKRFFTPDPLISWDRTPKLRATQNGGDVGRSVVL
jgi:hypothetical protein